MTVRILTGDCRAVLKTLPDDSVHCCVTSPPYFGLRDYGVAEQIGLEDSPAEYVAELVSVFREVRRVLRDDATLWLNLGDSYAGSWGAQSREHAGKHAPNVSALSANQVKAAVNKTGTGSLTRMPGLKAKDMIGVPWRVAFALQADGWWLRQDIIWSKPNPMPESVTDRCTKAHEYVFLLSKSQTYHCDMAAIAEPVAPATVSRLSQDVEGQAGSDRVPGKTNPMKAVSLSGNKERRQRVDFGGPEGTGSNQAFGVPWEGDTRNKRSVWTIATQPYSGAHFATMAPELAETCIKAGCPIGGVVLDPFGGAGTTGLVADRLQRAAILIELNPTYAALAERRIVDDAPLFAEVAA